MSTKIYVVFYSLYSHVYQLAEAIVEGAKEVKNTEVNLYQVSELMSEDALEKSGAKETRENFSHVPYISPDQLGDADAIIFGTPTRFGNMATRGPGNNHYQFPYNSITPWNGYRRSSL